MYHFNYLYFNYFTTLSIRKHSSELLIKKIILLNGQCDCKLSVIVNYGLCIISNDVGVQC